MSLVPKGYADKDMVEGILLKTIENSATGYLNNMIATAEIWVDNYCEQSFTATTGEVMQIDGNDFDYLPLPKKVRAISTVVVTGGSLETIEPWSYSISADYIRLEEYGIRYIYGTFPTGYNNISVTGDFGWTAVPYPVQLATAFMAVKMWQFGINDSIGKSREVTPDFEAQYSAVIFDNIIRELLNPYVRGTSFGH